MNQQCDQVLVDTAIGRIYEACKENGYILMVTADHGNAEKMIDPNGGKHTAHTCNPGQFFLLLAETGKTWL